MRLSGYWQEHPPLHILLAGYLGYKPGQRPQELSGEEIGQLSAWFGAPQKPPAHVAELVRWAEEMKQKS
jgi:hypothetical protein